MSAGGLLRGARDRGARYARTTGEDIVQLADVFWQVARRHAGDALAGGRRRAGASACRAGRGLRKRLG